ncbi:kinase-like protein [Rhizoclosmatium globosum]|uniref:Kinase-like protein n=1 Tax=Rhizoclosmatium globosum TaxID=329046 RepID=A0A1Y2BP67_9FUNG|nr:kinase-like protein [Rhizoclosmatium globosum]|eukprot:ORY36544.1 kinase-like protein [Rhizoclosmatium globosum]
MGICCSKVEEQIDFEQEVNLGHFDLLRAIGKGAFGKVKIVQHKLSKEKYALKYINKEQCIKMKAVDNIIQERKLLEIVNCPFVCNLIYAFQDDEHMFMVMDLKLGGDLRFLLTNNNNIFPEEWVKFYVAQIALGLMYLHSKHVVHRDLKPDNILLDIRGNACLTDFNISTYWKEGKPLHAVAGSLVYMAPEILEQKAGYTYTIDWWSLGVIHYEMLCGKRPFRAKKNDDLKKLIISGPLEFPPDDEIKISEPCKDVIKGFLTRPAVNRLGSKESGGDTRINTHEWFIDYDWEKLDALEVTPPYVPDASKFNFDDKHDMDEIFYEDTPLKAKPRKKEKDGRSSVASKLSRQSLELAKEYDKIEAQYTNFDITKLPTPAKDRKKSKVWEAKMGEIQRSVSMSRASLASNRSSAVDIMDNRSEHVDMEEELGTLRSKAGSVVSRGGSQKSLEQLSPDMPTRPEGKEVSTGDSASKVPGLPEGAGDKPSPLSKGVDASEQPAPLYAIPPPASSTGGTTAAASAVAKSTEESVVPSSTNPSQPTEEPKA